MMLEKSKTTKALLILLILYVQTQEASQNFRIVQFQNYVFCPISHDPTVEQKLKVKNLEKTYVISIREYYVERLGQRDQVLGICGLARKWHGDCKDAQYICSSPGPAFDVETGEKIYVLWRNEIKQIDGDYLFGPRPRVESREMGGCFNKTVIEKYGKASKCYPKRKKKGLEQFTYYDPTDFRDEYNSTEKNEISFDNNPVSPHIHGFEIRPAFDGNPISWFSKTGVGPGYFSAEMEYFQDLDKEDKEIVGYLQKQYGKVGSKINIYPNYQKGTYFYHDHAMSSTGFNNLKGLNGFYIVRDSNEAEELSLPSRDYEEIISVSFITLKATPESLTHKFKMNATYRLRILNQDQQRQFNNLTFLYDCSDDLEELRKCQNRLQFTIIGADTALRKYPFKNNILSLVSAERVQVLIRFPDIGKDSYSVYLFNNGSIVTTNLGIFYRMKVEGTDSKQELGYQIPQTLDVPWTDLSLMDSSKIPKKMIGIIFFGKFKFQTIDKRDFYYRFTFNAHIDYYDGSSDKPVIGSTEDWYFVNTVQEKAHPIHFHLLRFQIQAQYSLKLINENTTYYHVDFFFKYAQLDEKECAQKNPELMKIKVYRDRWKAGELLTIEEYEKLADIIYLYGIETGRFCFDNNLDIQSKFDERNIAGLNVMEKCPQDHQNCTVHMPAGQQEDCSEKGYKYICNNITKDIPLEKRGWKEVAFAHVFTIVVIRIRWTNIEYEEGSNQPFFFEKERNLLQFPGFVYHCHFLSHEDNTMMRPLMMQPSGREKTALWKDEFRKINEKANERRKQETKKGLRGFQKWKKMGMLSKRTYAD